MRERGVGPRVTPRETHRKVRNMTDAEHEADRWIIECVANMKAKLNLTTGQVIDRLHATVDRELGVEDLEEGGDEW